MKPETVLRATRLIRTGEVFELGRVLRSDMPFSSGRRFEMEAKRTNMNAGSNRRGSNEEIVFSEIGQVGTQFDGFTHQTIGDSLYNCVKVGDVATRNGIHEARHRTCRIAHHARRADRRRGAQRRADAGATRIRSPSTICSRRCSGRS